MEKTKLVDELKPLQKEIKAKDSESMNMLAEAIKKGKEEGLVREEKSGIFTFTLLALSILRF